MNVKKKSLFIPYTFTVLDVSKISLDFSQSGSEALQTNFCKCKYAGVPQKGG